MLARASAVRMGAASVLLLASLVAVSWPKVAAAVDGTPTYAFTDLGANFRPVAVNRSNTVIGTAVNPDTGVGPATVWSDGTRTTLTAPTAGMEVAPSGITDDGVVVATESHGEAGHIVVWNSPTDPPAIKDLPGYDHDGAYGVDEVSGNIAAQGVTTSGSSGFAIIDRTGAVLRSLPERTHAFTTSAHTYLGSDGATNFIGNIATGKTTSLDTVTGWMASDGSVIGEVYGDSSTILRTPDGTETTLNIEGGRQVNARHDVLSDTQVLFAGAATPVESSSLMPTGWSAATITGLGDNGSLVGFAGAPDGNEHGFLLHMSAVSGTVYGVHCTASSCGRSAMKGQLVLVKGTTAAGEAFSATTHTDGKGRYDLDAPAGSYQVGPAFSGSENFIGSAFDPETYTVQIGAQAATGKDFEVCAGGAASAATTSSSFARAAAAETTKASACESVYTVTMQASLPSGTVVDPSTYARYNRNSAAGDADYRDSIGRVDSILHTYPFTSKAAGVAREYPACLTETQLKKLDGKNIDWYSEFEGGSSLGQLKVTLAVLQGKAGDTVRVVGEPTVSNPKVTKVWHYRYKDSGKYVYNSCHLDEHAKPVVVPIAGAEPGRSGLDSSQFAIAVAWAFPYDPTGLSLRTEPTGIAAILHYFGKLGEKLYKSYEKLPEFWKLVVDTIIGFAIGGKYVKAVEKSADLITAFAPALKYLPRLAGITAEGLHFALAARDVVYYVAGYAGDYPIMGSVVRGNFTPHYCSWHGVKSDFVCGSIISLGAESAKFPDIELKIRRDAKDKTASEGGDTVYTGKYLPWHGISAGGSVVSFNPFSHNGNYLLSDTNGHSYHSGTNAVTAITDATVGHDALKPLERGVEEDATPVADFDTILADLPDPTCNTDADAAHDRAHTICYYIHDGRP